MFLYLEDNNGDKYILNKDYIKFTMDKYIAKRIFNKENIYNSYIVFNYDEISKEIIAYISEE